MPASQKSDFLKIGGTVIITLLVVYLINSNSNLDQPDPGIKDHLISTSEMIDYCTQFGVSNKIPIWYDLEGTPQEGMLEGFPIAISVLETIIENNACRDNSGLLVKPDTLLFYLGQDGTTTNRQITHGNIRLIALGMKNGKFMIPKSPNDWGDKTKSSIYDKALPCPGPGCPVKSPQHLLD